MTDPESHPTAAENPNLEKFKALLDSLRAVDPDLRGFIHAEADATEVAEVIEVGAEAWNILQGIYDAAATRQRPAENPVASPVESVDEKLAAASYLAAPELFSDAVDELFRQKTSVNVAQIIQEVLGVKRLSDADFQLVHALLKARVSAGELRRSGIGSYSHNSIQATAADNGLDARIQSAIGGAPVPMHKPRQRGRPGRK